VQNVFDENTSCQKSKVTNAFALADILWKTLVQSLKDLEKAFTLIGAVCIT
jgi:hypothetical protein